MGIKGISRGRIPLDYLDIIKRSYLYG